jgi:hypothetical protein
LGVTTGARLVDDDGMLETLEEGTADDELGGNVVLGPEGMLLPPPPPPPTQYWNPFWSMQESSMVSSNISGSDGFQRRSCSSSISQMEALIRQ